MSRGKLDAACRLAFVVAATIVTLRPSRGQGNDDKLPHTSVHVAVFGPFGEKIPMAQIHLRSRDGKRDLTARDSVIDDVPYGSYTLSAWDAGGGIGERVIAVNAKEVWVRIGLAFPTGDRTWPGGDLSISGDIRPALKGADWWVRVEGVFLNTRRESPVSQKGQFSVGGLEMGSYLLEVFEGAKLRHVETVEIDIKQTNTRVRIFLPPGS